MRLTFNLYRLVKFVDSETQRLDKEYPDKLKNESKRIVPKKGDILKYYNRDHPKMQYERISEYFDYATENHYLKQTPVGRKKLITVDSKGREIIDGWKLFPWWGLAREIWKSDGTVLRLIFVLIVAFIGGNFFHNLVAKLWHIIFH